MLKVVISCKTQLLHLCFFLFFRKVPKEFHLDYDKLEDRPSLPASLTGAQHSGVGGPTAPSSAGSPAPPPMGSMAALQQAQISPNMNSGGPMQPPGAL